MTRSYNPCKEMGGSVVTPPTNQILDELSNQTGKSKQSLVEQAVEMLKRELFFDSCDKAYEGLAQDKAALKKYQQEIEEWSESLADGIKDE